MKLLDFKLLLSLRKIRLQALLMMKKNLLAPRMKLIQITKMIMSIFYLKLLSKSRLRVQEHQFQLKHLVCTIKRKTLKLESFQKIKQLKTQLWIRSRYPSCSLDSMIMKKQLQLMLWRRKNVSKMNKSLRKEMKAIVCTWLDKELFLAQKCSQVTLTQLS